MGESGFAPIRRITIFGLVENVQRAFPIIHTLHTVRTFLVRAHLLNNFLTDMNPPFQFGRAIADEFFTDRQQESERLLANFQNGINTILISPRRWGKTSLVKKVAKSAATNELKIIYIDIFQCREPEDFFQLFVETILKHAIPKWQQRLQAVGEFLTHLAPKITVSPDSTNEFSIALDLKKDEKTPAEILNLPDRLAEKLNCNFVICIDEFQQIGEFKDSLSFQKLLRSAWQHHTRTSYCLFGSQKHLMQHLFTDKSLPFYKFGDVIYLTKIPTREWVSFIVSRFQNSGKNITPEQAQTICQTVDNHSSYVQQLSWLVWLDTTTAVTQPIIENAKADLIAQNSPLFEALTTNLTAPQLRFLKAVMAGEEKLTTQAAIEKYKLNSSANVMAIKKALIKRDIIEVYNERLTFTDPVLALWLAQE